jgi:hypothetical protein
VPIVRLVASREHAACRREGSSPVDESAFALAQRWIEVER